MNRILSKFKFEPVKVIPFVWLGIVCFLTLGYSAFSSNLLFSGIGAVVRAYADIRITNLSAAGVENSGSLTNSSFDVDSITSDISLPNSDSTVSFDVVVTNVGNVDMGIRDITLSSDSLTYTFDGYTLGSTLCDDNDNRVCNCGSVSTIHLTISYADGEYDSSNTDFSLLINFDFYEITYVARIEGNYYQTLQAAINAVPTNHTETTVVLLKNTAERVTINPGKEVVLDLQGFVISNADNNTPVIEVFGTKRTNNDVITDSGGASLRINNGIISSTAAQGAINVEEGGTLTMTGGTVNATGDRQALYVNKGGTAFISGTAYFSAKAVAVEGNKRGTVQTVAGTVTKTNTQIPPGNLTITGGTIEANSATGVAVSCYGVITLGTEDGNINTSVPNMRGNGSGIYIATNGTLNFYDGIAKGKTVAIENENAIADIETGYSIVHTSTVINNATYDTALLGHGVLVTFNPNEGAVDESSRNVLVNSAIGNLPVPTREGYVFEGWFTENGVEVTSNTVIAEAITFIAHWISEEENYVALIGNTKYNTLAAAISAVTTNTATTITLVKNVSEYITIPSGRNITLDLQSYTLSLPSDAASNIPTIDNKGNLTLVSGSVTTSSPKTAAINNNSKAKFTMTGGSIIATGDRQAIYNNGGTVVISGSSYLKSKALVDSNNKRGTVHNLASSTLLVTGGTIESVASGGIGVSNFGTVTFGANDGNISTTSPVIKGLAIGVYNTSTLNFYDGIFKGQTNAIVGNITNQEANSTQVNGNEVIDGVTYKTLYLN